ncbi:DUF2789 domain-containing protein [Balneatrix alpica]|uniref:DUF2789 domain-containing protein n=1 Tax=Balneatrix alpica TaxID=75684 RepID=A0ABV5ZEG8_9GAMM|nr:DUF2789 domain-containing protein [Balneatrix alpica]
MDTTPHTLSTLFAQLGLDSSSQAINQFIRQQGPLPDDLPLEQASCWNPAQARFIQEALAQDSDWSEVVDELNVLMRRRH